MLVSCPAFTRGGLLTLTLTVSVPKQPAPSPTVTVYTVVFIGEAIGFAMLTEERPVAGLH